jgi:uncharacterized phage protein (TIGR02220 family)
MREQTRLRVAKHRDTHKLCNVTVTQNVTQCNAIDIDIEEDKEIDKEIYKNIIDYLNLKNSSCYKTSSKTTQKHINARLTEGYTLENFITVIDKKVAEWKDDSKMQQYLRPETLFGTKFEAYLNQKENVKPQDNPKSTNKFNQYPQRTYTPEDYADLEKKLINKGL